MPKIVNESYLEFLEKGTIHIMTPEEFHKKLDAMKIESGAFKKHEWKNFLRLLFWSGRRPAEILQLKAKDLTRKGRFVSIMFETLKKGRTTLFYFNILKVPDIKTVVEWAKRRPPEILLFPSLRSKRKKTVKWVTKSGEKRSKQYFQISDNITYFVKKAFGVPPYFFRHNRFSDMMLKGALDRDVKHAKGAKDFRSVEAYTHLSLRKAKEISKYIS